MIFSTDEPLLREKAINEKHFSDPIRNYINDLRMAPDPQTFQTLYDTFVEEYLEDEQAKKFLDLYGESGKVADPTMWSQGDRLEEDTKVN